MRLLAANRFAVHRSRWRVAALATAASLVNSALGLGQRAVHGRRIAATPVARGPVFILGHWRTGTTLLHELLGRDPRHAFPTTYECFAPHHFLLTRPWLPRLLARLGPTRPMDRMAAGYDRPQEDEFALCLLGQPSPYRRIAFPNRAPAGDGSLDLCGLSPRALRRWKEAYHHLVQAWTLAHGGRRLVLKSPPHTCRVGTLLELFPDARLVHVVRDPYDVYPSTLHLWRVLYGLWGLQRPTWEGLPELVLDTFTQVYDRLEEGKRLIPPGRFIEVRYEDLVRDPVAQVEVVYHGVGLGDFAPARPHVEEYVAGMKGYEVNRYLLTPDERRTVTRRWGEVIRRYGYALRAD
ncbi:MAG: sulfotransferase [Gemmataceae bacterium]